MEKIVTVLPPNEYPKEYKLAQLGGDILSKIFSQLLPTNKYLRLLEVGDPYIPSQKRVNTTLFRVSWYIRKKAYQFLLAANIIVIKPNVYNLACVFLDPGDFSNWLANVTDGYIVMTNLQLLDYEQYMEDERGLAQAQSLLTECEHLKRLEVNLQASFFFTLVDSRSFMMITQEEMIERYELLHLLRSPKLKTVLFVLWLPPPFWGISHHDLTQTLDEFARRIEAYFKERKEKPEVQFGFREDRSVVAFSTGMKTFVHWA